jgi:zinc finger protein
MATTCNYCGYKSNEVKSGCGVSETGTRTVLRIANISDLNRDVIFSETCVLHIPCLDFECSHSSVGGRFTTVEGILSQMKMQLQRSNPFLGDSVQLSHLALFLEKLSEIIDGKKLDVDIILDDPAGNSFIQNICAPEPDQNLTVTYYERTAEQNDQLGLTDMKTENYGEDN